MGDDVEEQEGEVAAKAIAEALAILRKHFDQAQILASREDSEFVTHWTNGFGNVFARIGLAHQWIEGKLDSEEE